MSKLYEKFSLQLGKYLNQVGDMIPCIQEYFQLPSSMEEYRYNKTDPTMLSPIDGLERSEWKKYKD